MDEHLILEFQTADQAQTCLDAINQLAAAFWADQGYTVLDASGHKELVGKNAATGTDMLDAARTVTWDTVHESPVGTFYFTSLSSDPRFPDWRDYLLEGTIMPNDTKMPKSWIAVDGT